MTKYLIVKCKELGDQFECDADREPMFLVDDWGEWFYVNEETYYELCDIFANKEMFKAIAEGRD